ncbi:hypothetical protein [Deinococcus sonorensis]|uniref:WD40 repeat protein n=2 Tax=Deinococcus sonorensis TaxID=309891 RepID=A0AAU7U5J3_9DEIO
MLTRLLSLLVMVLLSAASAATAPLVANIDGDLWSWTASSGWTQLTHWGHNGSPVLSPDGRMVAYASVTEEAVRAHAMGWSPTNIWLLDLASRTASRLTVQPPGARGAEGLVRSTPTWSPDGQFLAWTQKTAGTQPARHTLVVYSLSNAATLVAATAARTLSVSPAPAGVLWSPAGLIVLGEIPSGPAHGLTPLELKPGERGTFGASVLTAAGDVVRHVILPEAGAPTHLTRRGNAVYLGSLEGSPLVSLTGGADVDRLAPGALDTTPERMVAVRAPQGLAFRFLMREMTMICQVMRAGKVIRQWPCQNVRLTGPDFDEGFEVTLAPDGRQAAYVRDGALFVHDGHTERRILELQGRDVYGLVWGPVEFRLP